MLAEKLSLTGQPWDFVAGLDLNHVGYAIAALFVAHLGGRARRLATRADRGALGGRPAASRAGERADPMPSASYRRRAPSPTSTTPSAILRAQGLRVSASRRAAARGLLAPRDRSRPSTSRAGSGAGVSSCDSPRRTATSSCSSGSGWSATSTSATARPLRARRPRTSHLCSSASAAARSPARRRAARGDPIRGRSRGPASRPISATSRSSASARVRREAGPEEGDDNVRHFGVSSPSIPLTGSCRRAALTRRRSAAGPELARGRGRRLGRPGRPHRRGEALPDASDRPIRCVAGTSAAPRELRGPRLDLGDGHLREGLVAGAGVDLLGEDPVEVGGHHSWPRRVARAATAACP